MENGKTAKYFKYAVGEIILVVIGILIALQINDWNTQRLNGIKEDRILLEIKENLNEDLQRIDAILAENTIKLQAIDSSFYYLSEMNKKIENAQKFSSNFRFLTSYNLFKPTRVAFDNMISSGNIDILKSDVLRKELSRYYSSDLLDGIQDQLIVSTQGFLKDIAPKMMNKDMMKHVTNLDFDVRPATAITVFQDPYVISNLFVMRNKTKNHDSILNSLIVKINELIASIDSYLETK